MDNEQLINMVSEGIVQKVQQALETNQASVNDENVPPIGDNQRPTDELLLALTQPMDAFGQALATIQQNVPPVLTPQNPYCTFIPQQVPPYGYPQYPSNTQAPVTTQPSGPSPPKPARWKIFGRYCHSCGACDHWGNKCL